LLKETQEQLDHHKAGTRLLDASEREALEKKADIYQRKLATMQGDLDVREVDRIIEREKLHHERMKERRAERGEL
jgi:Trp operon repressor